jgi:hypothetical protein
MKKIRNTRVLAALLTGLAAVLGTVAHAESPEALHDCRAIQDEPKRLRCYDSVPDRADTETPSAPGEPAGAQEKPALEQRLEKERDLARRAFIIIPHRPNYILATYNGEPNVAPFQSTDPNTDFQHQEIKFRQLVFRSTTTCSANGDRGLVHPADILAGVQDRSRSGDRLRAGWPDVSTIVVRIASAVLGGYRAPVERAQ